MQTERRGLWRLDREKIRKVATVRVTENKNELSGSSNRLE